MIPRGRLLLYRKCYRIDFGATESIRRQLRGVQNGVGRIYRSPPGRIPDARSGPKEAPRAPETVPNGASEKGKDDPEAEGLKKEGAKSSKIGTIQKKAFNVHGKHILKE